MLTAEADPDPSSASAAQILKRARAVVLAVLAAEVVALAVTGIVLLVAYRPSGDVGIGVVVAPPGGLGGSARTLHQFLGWATPATALVAGVLAVLADRGAVVRRWWPAVAASVAVVAATLGSVTGLLLPWDQVALEAVTVAERFDGYGFLVDGSARFALIDGAEVSIETLRTVMALHLALGVVLAAAVVAALLTWRRRASASSLP